jgi:hypothetical protein
MTHRYIILHSIMHDKHSSYGWVCQCTVPSASRCSCSTYNAVARDFPLSARQVLENLKNRAAEVSSGMGRSCAFEQFLQVQQFKQRGRCWRT